MARQGQRDRADGLLLRSNEKPAAAVTLHASGAETAFQGKNVFVPALGGKRKYGGLV